MVYEIPEALRIGFQSTHSRGVRPEVVAAVDSKKMKEWAHHYTTNIFTYSKDEEQIRTLRDKLKNEKESIIAQFKKAYKL